MKLLLATLLLALISCASDPPSDSLACPQTIDAYCSTSPIKCARTIDPKDIAFSFCAASGPGASFGTATCPSGSISIIFENEIWTYDPTKHELTAVVSKTGTCIAGPASLPKRSEQCSSNLVGYSCGGPRDGGDDAASD